MVVVFTSTAGLTGIEIGIAGGSAVVGQKLLEAIFGEDAVRRMATRARKMLDSRAQALTGQTMELYSAEIDSAAQPETAQTLSRVTEALNGKGAKK